MFSFGAPLTAPCTASAAFSSTAQHRWALPRRKLRVCCANMNEVSQLLRHETAIHKRCRDTSLWIWDLLCQAL
jgi:crotonobetainyl-CoA:carnitine CoA-transferase CaiB-like acyl-CoA transferase